MYGKNSNRSDAKNAETECGVSFSAVFAALRFSRFTDWVMVAADVRRRISRLNRALFRLLTSAATGLGHSSGTLWAFSLEPNSKLALTPALSPGRGST